jgi:hypothetical protein
LCAPLALTSCTDYDTNPPVITAENPIMMNVGTVEVVAQPNYNNPSLLRVAPEYLVQEWFNKKVQAMGSSPRRFTVEVVKSATYLAPAASSPKFDAYTTELTLAMKLYEPTDNLAVMTSEVAMKLTRELKRGGTVPEREAFFAGLTRELVRKMDVAIPAQLHKYFNSYVIPE